MKAKGISKMNANTQTDTDPKDLDSLVDDLFADSNIEVDENSEEPVVFEYTNTEVKEMIVSGRVRMLIKHPFFGTLATRLKLVEAQWCPNSRSRR